MANSGTEKYRLVYFDLRALAEPIRWIFVHSDTPFIDERIPYNFEKWFGETKQKYSSTVGQIPILHENGRPELCQSTVISRYLAKKFGLVADNDWDNARIDEVISLVYDLFIWWRTTMFTRVLEQKKLLKVMLNGKVRAFYQKFSDILQEEEGDFILGSKLTHADFWLANFISMIDDPFFTGELPVMADNMPTITESDIYVGLTSEYPLLKKHLEVVSNLPKIKEWISKRPQTIF